jgi:hypothetical protein
MAARLAAPDAGIVIAASIAGEDATDAQLATQRGLRDQAAEWLARLGLEARSIFRVSRSLISGILQIVRAEKVSMLVGEWHFQGLDPNSETSKVLTHGRVPFLLTHGAMEPFDRLVVVARPKDVREAAADLQLAAAVAERIAAGKRVVFVGSQLGSLVALFRAKLPVDQIESADPLGWARDHATAGDLLIIPGLQSVRDALARFVTLADGRFLVTIAPHAAAAKEEAAAGLVVGRSLSEQPA